MFEARLEWKRPRLGVYTAHPEFHGVLYIDITYVVMWHRPGKWTAHIEDTAPYSMGPRRFGTFRTSREAKGECLSHYRGCDPPRR